MTIKRVLDRYNHEAETGHLLAQLCDQKNWKTMLRKHHILLL